MKNKKDLLAEAIRLLENRQEMELKLLKEQFHYTYESLKPINLIKSTFEEVQNSPEMRKNLLNTVVGMATGYLSNKVLSTAAQPPLKKILGTILQFAVAKVVSSNSDSIIASGESFLQRLMKSKTDKKQAFSKN